MVKTLIEAGGLVDSQNIEGQTVLHLACMMGDDNTVAFHCAFPADCRETEQCRACLPGPGAHK